MSQSFPGSMTVALVPMSAKPFHAGHYGLIDAAAQAHDHVMLYVSLSDRKRKGELPIKGSDMEQIWRHHIEGALPGNVEVEYGGNPIRNVFEQLGAENERMEEGDDDVATYSIYGDPEDVKKNFPVKSLEKYAGTLWKAKKVKHVPVSRTSTVDVSGTKMRELIAAGDAEGFMNYLPDQLGDESRQAIWNLLSGQD